MKSKKSTVTSSLLALSVTLSTGAKSQALDCAQALPGCYCYSEKDVEVLSGGLLDLQKCEADILEKEKLIAERLMDFKGPQEGKLWWNEPYVLGGSITFSFALGIVTTLFIQGKLK